MSYRGFQIHTINYPPGWWHAHIERDGAGFTTLPSTHRLESDAWNDAERLVDGLVSSAESIDGGMEEVWQHSTEV